VKLDKALVLVCMPSASPISTKGIVVEYLLRVSLVSGLLVASLHDLHCKTIINTEK
jgi:hypothetical protein